MTVADRAAVVAPLVGDLPDELVHLAARLTPIQGEVLQWSGPTVRVHVHNAHAPHHLAAELPDLGLLVAGDMLSDIELPMPDEQDLDLLTYRQGLESLQEVVKRSRVLIPGHGDVTDRPARRFEADLRYLDDLSILGVSDDPRIALAGMSELHE